MAFVVRIALKVVGEKRVKTLETEEVERSEGRGRRGGVMVGGGGGGRGFESEGPFDPATSSVF